MPRQPAHFKVRVSIANHWRTAALWRIPELRAAYVGLGLLAIDKYAQRTGGTFLVTATELVEATGARNPGAATNRLERLARVARESWERGPLEEGRWGVGGESPPGRPAVTYEPHEGHFRVTLFNLKKNQGFRMENEPETEPQRAPSATTTTTTPRKEEEATPKRVAPAAPPPVCFEIAESLRSWIRKGDPEARVPEDLTPWAREADRMLRIDKRDADQVQVAIEWLFTVNAKSETPFVVLSMKALRAKYDRMRQVAKRDREREQHGTSRGKPDPAAAARERLASRHGPRTH